MAKFYLHKQTFVIAIVCFLAVGATAGYTYWQPAPIEPQNIAVDDATTSTNTIIADNADWKKLFLNSSSTAINLKSGNSNDSADEGPLTLTDQFSRDTFAEFALLNQAGLTGNTAVVSSTVATILSKESSSFNAPREYSTDDVTFSLTNDTASLKSYGNTLGQILETYSPQKSSASIAFAGIQGKDTSYIDELNANAKNYQKILKNLLKTPVPPAISSSHVSLINGISNMQFISTSLGLVQTDPLLSMNSLQMYQNSYTEILGGLIGIRKALTDAGIKYAPTESGSYLNI